MHHDPAARTDGVTIHDVAVADTDAFLVEPDGGGGSGPAVLFLHWFDTEAPDGNRTQFLDEAIALARDHGVTSLLPQGRFPWSGPPTDAESDARRIRAELDRHRVALDLLGATEGVDATRIGLVGHDFGAMHGILAAVEDERVRAAVLIAATPRWGDWFLPFWPIAGDRFDYLRALSPLDPVTAVGRLAPRPVLLQFAKQDFYIAPMTALELAHAAGEPKELRWYEADHALRSEEARADRTAFLAQQLGW